MENQDFDIVINWERYILKFIGVWPEIETRFPLQFIGTFFIIVYFIILPQMADLYIIHTDMVLVSENLATANIAINIAILKLLTLRYNKKGLWTLINFMKEDWKNTKNKNHLIVMLEMGGLAKYINKMLIILTQVMLSIFIIMNIFVNVTGYLPSRQLFYRSYFPYSALDTPIYEITCFWQSFGGVLAAMAYAGADSFIGILVLHVCGQLSIIEYELRHLVDPIINGNNNALDLIHEKLKFITTRHEYLNKFTQSIEDIFNLMLLAQFVCLSIQLCFQGFTIYNALTNKTGITYAQLIFLIVFFVEIFVLFYLYCYVGEQLCIQTIGIRNAAYECKWYHLPPNQIKVLAYIILRTNTPLRITAGKFCTFSLVTFSEVIKRSVGYLSVLLTVRES